MKKTAILVVDDEPKVVRLVQLNLESLEFRVTSSPSGSEALQRLAGESPDLVLLDLMLPDLDGIEVCRRLREFSDVPVIMLTARAREIDKVAGFQAGADDYITKPFSAKELVARVQAVLRRAGGDPQGPTVVRAGNVRLDLVARRAYVDDQPVDLTATEYKLLSQMMVHKGKVLLHAHLLGAVWGPEYVDSLDYLRVYISHLRRKLGDTGQGPGLIRTVPGVGYLVGDGQDD